MSIMDSWRQRSWWGWGYESEQIGGEELSQLLRVAGSLLRLNTTPLRLPEPDLVDIPQPRIKLPGLFDPICATDNFARLLHASGCSYKDVVRSLHGNVENPPDAVCFPRNESDIVALLDYCSAHGIAVIPYGGGSSVVGGVEPIVGDAFNGVISLDMAYMNRVMEVDSQSRAALIETGALGPDLERQLKEHGMTLRHFPQSFARSTLGGWIATRAGGHFATGPTHIDEMVESVRMLTPSGVFETRRLPASGAGPSPDRMVIGSEGILGVITAAWMRTFQIPRFKTSRTYLFSTFDEAIQALRYLVQSGLQPSNCRVIDPLEALINQAGDGSHALMVVAFESAYYPVTSLAALADECIRDHGGLPEGGGEWRTSGQAADHDVASTWRDSFIRAPYIRDALVRFGAMLETFETAVTWDRFDRLYSSVMDATHDVLQRLDLSPSLVTCRITHAYPDGLAPYFTVIARAKDGNELADWNELKNAASSVIMESGGTITHHHAVGREHRQYYDIERPDLFARSLVEAKRVMDPSGILNPGVLI